MRNCTCARYGAAPGLGDVDAALTAVQRVQASYAVFPVGVTVCTTCSGVQCVPT